MKTLELHYQMIQFLIMLLIIQQIVTLSKYRERRNRGSHDFKFIVPRGHKDTFRFSFFPRTITEWNKLPQETV